MTEGAVVLSDITGAVPEPSRIVFVGNPPYQENTGGFGIQARAIYQNFVSHGLQHGDEALFVLPARWYAGGMGLGEFRRMMITSAKVKQIVDFLLTLRW